MYSGSCPDRARRSAARSHQPLLAGVVLAREHRSLRDSGLAVQGRFDLAQLDAEATDLDLVVDAPHVVQAAIGQPAHQVAAAVHAATGGIEGIGDKTLGRQGRAIQIAARQVFAGDVQLAGHAYRDRLQASVEHVHLGVVQRRADRHART